MTRWVYDQAGNITSQVRVTDAGSETDVRTYNNLNQLETSSGGWTYQYDPDGNLIEKNNGDTEDCEKWEFTWNENSRLVQVKKGVYDATPTLVNEFTVDYQYDEMGRMLRRDDGTDVTHYFYDGWDIWKEVTGESVTEYLVPGLGIQSFLRDGELYTLHSDGVSSVRTVTDADGDVAARIELDAWGQTLSGSADLVPGGLPTGFVGALGVRKDPLSGLYYMRHRWYYPSLQRFISMDPIGLVGSTNLYAYVKGSPTNEIDPFGLQEGKPQWDPEPSYDPFPGESGSRGHGYLRSHPQPPYRQESDPDRDMDFVAGYGDSMSFGISRFIRWKMGTSDMVNTCSLAYEDGGRTALFTGLARLAYAGIARAIPSVARAIHPNDIANAAYTAYATRNAMKVGFRSVIFAKVGGRLYSFEQMLEKYKGSYEAILSAAGRTGKLENLYGAWTSLSAMWNRSRESECKHRHLKGVNSK